VSRSRLCTQGLLDFEKEERKLTVSVRQALGDFHTVFTTAATVTPSLKMRN
jgi:hypothetical protein